MGIPLRATASGRGWTSTWVETAPGDGLDGADAIESVWSGRAGRSGRLRIFPDACVDLTWNGDRLRVMPAAPAVSRVPLVAQRPADGMRIRCGAAGALLGTGGPASLVVDLSDVGVPGVRALEQDLRAASRDPARRRRLLTTWAVDRAAATAHRPLLPRSVIDRITAGVPLAEVAAAHGMSERTLRREAALATGMGLKLVARLRRFRGFLDRLPRIAAGEATLAGTAADLGYADQSHLGRECRSIAAARPASLVGAWRRAGWPESSRLSAADQQG